MGQALSARLRFAMQQANIPLWLNTVFQELIVDDERVVGIVAQKEDRSIRILARKGVILADGGFPHNLEMRKKYLPEPASTQWTVASTGNTGDAIQAGIQLGAATDLMDDAWWDRHPARRTKNLFFMLGNAAIEAA